MRTMLECSCCRTRSKLSNESRCLHGRVGLEEARGLIGSVTGFRIQGGLVMGRVRPPTEGGQLCAAGGSGDLNVYLTLPSHMSWKPSGTTRIHQSTSCTSSIDGRSMISSWCRFPGLGIRF